MNIYLLFSTLILVTGISMILSSNPVHSILNLILVFFLAACFSVFLGFEFLALLILIVYVGAISVLFLFIVMLLNVRVVELNESMFKYWWLGCLYGGFFMLQISYTFYTVLPINAFLRHETVWYHWGAFTLDFSSNVEILGELLFLYYVHLFIFASFVLFVAIISPIILSFLRFDSLEIQDLSVKNKNQNNFQQMLRYSFERNFNG